MATVLYFAWGEKFTGTLWKIYKYTMRFRVPALDQSDCSIYTSTIKHERASPQHRYNNFVLVHIITRILPKNNAGNACSYLPWKSSVIERHFTLLFVSCVCVCVCVCVFVCVHRYYDRDLLKNNNRRCPLVLKTEGKLETSTIDFFLVPVATDFNYSRVPDELSQAEPSRLGRFCKNNMNETDLSTCIHSQHRSIVYTLLELAFFFACFWRWLLLLFKRK